MNQFKRNYHYRGADTQKESRQFWIFIILGILIGAAIAYFF